MPRLFSASSTVVRSLFVSAVLIGLVGTLGATRPNLMLVEHVAFEGHGEATAPELRHLADIRNGDRIWEVDIDRVARGVERHPWVRRAHVHRQFPDTVVVRVEEHRPVALLHYGTTDGGGRLYYVAEDGTVFLPADGTDLDHPSLTGITADLEARHPGLPRLVVRDALHLVDALDAGGVLSSDRISEVAFRETRGFTVHAGKARILFALTDVPEQVRRLSALLDSGTVDLDRPLHVDLGPETVAIVRPLDAQFSRSEG
jgi:cell division protein FtsQ